MYSFTTIISITLGIISIIGIELFIYNNQLKFILSTPNLQGTKQADYNSASPIQPTIEDGVDVELSSSQQLRLDLARLLTKFRLLIHGLIVVAVTLIIFYFSPTKQSP